MSSKLIHVSRPVLHVFIATVEECCLIFSRVVWGHSLHLYNLSVYKERYNIKIRKKANIRNLYNQVLHLAQDTIWESDKNTRKTPGKTSHTTVKRSVLSQQVTTRLQGTDKTIRQRQTRNTNNKNDPQKKHRHFSVFDVTSGPRWRPPRLPIQDGGPHGVRSKMAAPTKSDTKSNTRWRSL